MDSTTFWRWAVAAVIWLLAFGWLWQAMQWLLHLKELPDLTRIAPAAVARIPAKQSQDQPRLTVVVPACNEQDSIGTTLRSLLASQGLRLQIIAVNDRSTDRTGAIMDEVAGECAASGSPHRLQVLHIGELPPEWLGKPHALACGIAIANADWLLLTDGDVRFAPNALALALGYAQTAQLDHLVLMPDWITLTHGEAAMHGALHALSSWNLHPWRVSDPAARDFLGVGAFNLVRRSACEAIGGLTALRMEVLEDVRLGWLLKRGGFRSQIALGPALVSVRWSRGAWGVVRNLEKNLFALYRYRIGVTLFVCLGLSIQFAWPLAALFANNWARAGAIADYVAVTLIYIASRKATGIPARYAVVYPLATGLFLFAILRSMLLALVRGGVQWRGTRYSLKELRKYAGPFW